MGQGRGIYHKLVLKGTMGNFCKNLSQTLTQVLKAPQSPVTDSVPCWEETWFPHVESVLGPNTQDLFHRSYSSSCHQPQGCLEQQLDKDINAVPHQVSSRDLPKNHAVWVGMAWPQVSLSEFQLLSLSVLPCKLAAQSGTTLWLEVDGQELSRVTFASSPGETWEKIWIYRSLTNQWHLIQLRGKSKKLVPLKAQDNTQSGCFSFPKAVLHSESSGLEEKAAEVAHVGPSTKVTWRWMPTSAPLNAFGKGGSPALLSKLS